MSDQQVVYVPPAQQFMSPYPQAMIADYTGAEGAGLTSAATGAGAPVNLSDLPLAYNLSWVAGDTAYFSFFFQNVCWLPAAPTPPPTLYAWENVTWRSQVRTPQSYYFGYWWPPTWPLGAFIMEFTVTATYMENDATLGTGTLVTIKGGTTWPGNYVWDLQSEHHVDQADLTYYEAHTRIAGSVTV